VKDRSAKDRRFAVLRKAKPRSLLTGVTPLKKKIKHEKEKKQKKKKEA
jgi:NADH:ubiquinone oxidoreductase subunit B-like Fe-S oxidoreductase